jgi:hypothetical protein
LADVISFLDPTKVSIAPINIQQQDIVGNHELEALSQDVSWDESHRQLTTITSGYNFNLIDHVITLVDRTLPQKRDPLMEYLYPIHDPIKQAQGERQGLIKRVSPDYTQRQGLLTLTSSSKDRRKESINFVYHVNKDKRAKKSYQTKNQDRPYLHVMWTASDKLLPEQKVIKDEYLVDISVADFDEGYAENDWNLVLPSREPNEVAVSVMWSF